MGYFSISLHFSKSLFSTLKIQPLAVLPYDGTVLDWNEISVQVEIQQIPSLPQILKSVPDSDFMEGQLALSQWAPHLMWNPPYPMAGRQLENNSTPPERRDVFQSVMIALYRRLSQGKMERNASRGAPPVSHPTVNRPITRCHLACSQRGTCNEELGRCDCPAGYMGTTCSELAMPGCQVAVSGVHMLLPCTLRSTCACARDCARYRFGWSTGYSPVLSPACHLDDSGLENDTSAWKRLQVDNDDDDDDDKYHLSAAGHADEDARSAKGGAELALVFRTPLTKIHFDEKWEVLGVGRTREFWEKQRKGHMDEPGQNPATDTEDLRMNIVEPWVDPSHCPNLCSLRGGCDGSTGEFQCW